MPKILEIKHDGHDIWVKVEHDWNQGGIGSVTLYTEKELDDLKESVRKNIMYQISEMEI